MKRESVVRSVAGTFVVASVALGYFVHPGFLLFTTFVGLNLLQSGLSGFCPLERMLEKAGVGRV